MGKSQSYVSQDTARLAVKGVTTVKMDPWTNCPVESSGSKVYGYFGAERICDCQLSKEVLIFFNAGYILQYVW